MFKFLFASFFLLFFSIKTFKKKGSFFYPSSFLFLLYFISVGLSLPHIFVNNETLSLNKEYFNSVIVFLVLLFMFIYPFYLYNEHKIKYIILPNQNLLKIISVSIVVISFLSIIVLMPGAIKAFSYTNLSDARAGGRQIEEGNILTTIASLASYLYSVAIILFYIYRAKGTNKTLSYLLIISSSSYIINVFTYTGRDGIVFWLFSFIATYGFFRNFLSKKDRSLVKRLLIIFSIIAVPLFWLITKDRFSDNPFAGILSYLGQSVSNFALSFHADYPVSYGASFPLFRRILGLEPIIPEVTLYGGTSTNVFGTFLKSFLENYDLSGVILIAIFMGLFIICNFKNNKNGSFYFYQFFIYFLYFQIYSQGIFYFTFYSISGNFFILLSFILFYLFKFQNKFQNKNSLILQQRNN